MLKKVHPLILLGTLVILLGAGSFWFFYQQNAPSPFDIVSAPQDDDLFLPILLPLENNAPAPTLNSLTPALIPAPSSLGAIPDTLEIPAIFLTAAIQPVHYIDIESGGQTYHQWAVPAEFAVGWQDESALLGLPGNTVLNGHHNAYGMVFKNLVKLEIGDLILLRSGTQEYSYLVAAKFLLPERGQPLATRLENARWLQASTDERLTLVTCWPAAGNTHRVIIVAYPVGAGQSLGGPPPATHPAGQE